MDNNEFLIDTAVVEIEPKQNFHYRYESEIRQGNSHGALVGQRGDHPKLKLRLPDEGLDEFRNKRDFFVLCSLHCFNENNKTLSPHLLMAKGESTLNYSFIFEQMKMVENNPAERFWELEDYVIVRVKKDDYGTSLNNKRTAYKSLKLPLDFERILGQLNLNDKRTVNDSGKLNVCLGFTIFEKDFYANKYSLYRDTIYSCNIYHGDDMKIHKLCNVKGSILGGNDVTILIRLIRLKSDFQLNVYIKKIDERTKQTIWHTIVAISENYIFQNSAITFTMPPYGGPECMDDEIEVNMCVMVENGTYTTDNVKYFYINENSRKRPREGQEKQDCDAEKRSKVHGNEMYISSDNIKWPEFSAPWETIASSYIDIKLKIDKIFKIAKDPKDTESYERLDSIFYDALKTSDAIIHLYKTVNETGKKQLIADFRNERHENLLHWACKMNLPGAIRSLVGLGCHINEQDNMGRTPLHVALSAQNAECVLEIQNLIKNYSKYPKEIETDLMKMIKAYSHNGYTVLHEAVLAQNEELFEMLMRFMEKYDMNALDYEVLGNGDSVVHLAHKINPKVIWQPIVKYVPNFEKVTNYAGLTIADLKDEKKEAEMFVEDELFECN